MIRALFWCPIGVRKAQEVPIATAIKKGSGLAPRRVAIVKAMGAMTTAVAALLRMSETVMVTIKMAAMTTTGGRPAVAPKIQSAMRPDAPVVSRAPPTFRCSCSQERVESMLESMGADEVHGIIEKRGAIDVRCEFCNKAYEFDAVDTERILLKGSGAGSSDSIH